MNRELPPQSLDAEACMLGSCLLHAPAIDIAASVCSPEMIYSEAHRLIYSALLRLHEAGEPVDTEIVVIELDKTGDLADAGGIPKVLEIIGKVPHAAHVEYYARQVRDRYRRRVACNAAQQINAGVRDLNRETEEVLHAAEAMVHEALEGGASTTAVPIGDIAVDLLLPTTQAKRQPITTGWPTLDGITKGGMRPGQLWILGARPSVGKSAAAAMIARRTAEAGNAVTLVSYEMDRAEITERLMLSALNVDEATFYQQRDSHLLQAAAQETEMLGRLPLSIDDSKPALADLLARLRVDVRRRGIKLAVVDYLQLIPYTGKAQNREQQIASMSRELKLAAGRLGITIMALSQLSREIERRESQRPRLCDLRESGAIEQDADTVLLLWRPNLKPPGSASVDGEPDNVGELIVAKQRGGRLGIVPLSWHGPTVTYRDRAIVDPLIDQWWPR